MKKGLLILALSLFGFSTYAQSTPLVQDENEIRTAQVKEALQHSWKGYVQYAWGHDQLRPISHTYFDWYEVSFLMTPVDSLDTFLLTGLKVEADQALDLILNRLSFDQDVSVSVFEFTIRLVGGLLSSYQMTQNPRLLVLAEDLAKRLLPAFDSPTGMPYTHVNLRTGAVSGISSNPAEVGSCTLEFGLLSQLTHNPLYFDKAKKAVLALDRHASPLGLVGASIDITSGKWLSTDSSIGGGIDSYYEYLYKGWILFHDEDLHRIWLKSIQAIQLHLADETQGGIWYGHADINFGKITQPTYGSLDAFFSGLLTLSGDLSRGRRLQDSNFEMWNQDEIEPESLNYRTMEVQDASYSLRPEVFESAYYLHYFTGEQKYQKMAASMFDQLQKHCRRDAGFSGLLDVRYKINNDAMESFFLAETLKYLYLTFAPLDALDLGHFVFNTEAHPLQSAAQ